MATTQIVLNILFVVSAIGALAVVARLAAKVAAGHFDELETRFEAEEPEFLKRAA